MSQQDTFLAGSSFSFSAPTAHQSNNTLYVQPYYYQANHSWGIASEQPGDPENERAAEIVYEDILDLNDGGAPGSPEELQDLAQEAVDRLWSHDDHEEGPVSIVARDCRTYALTKDPIYYSEGQKRRARYRATTRALIYVGMRSDGTCRTWCPPVNEVDSRYTGQFTLSRHFQEIERRVSFGMDSAALDTYGQLQSLDEKGNYLSVRVHHEANEVMRKAGHGVSVDVANVFLPDTGASAQSS